MSKFDNIIILSDMDGTFLGENSRLVPENIAAIKYFNQNGGRFAVNTGRNLITITVPYPEFKGFISAPIIMHNGACIYDLQNEKILYEKAIDTEIAIEIFNYLQGFAPEVRPTLRCLNSFHVMPPSYMSEWYKPFAKYTYNFYNSEDIRNMSVHKINFECENLERLAEIRADVECRFGDIIDCTSAEPTMIEVISKGVSKAIAIPRLKSLLHCENATVFAIGDYENDIEMIKAADCGACPSNALDTVKSVAKIHVCHHDKGAVADLIRIIEEKQLG